MSFEALLQSADGKVAQKLGGPAVYRSGAGLEVPLTGPFDAAYVRSDPRSPGISANGPAIFARVEELPAGWEGDVDATISRDGKTFSIVEAKPDGIGGVQFILHDAPGGP